MNQQAKSAFRRGVRKILWDALTLDEHLYDDAHESPRYCRIAQWIVAIAAISHAIGSAVILLVYRASVPFLIVGLVINGLSVFLGYYFWTFTIWKIGHWLYYPSRSQNKSFPVPAFQDLLAPIGFAHAPQVFNFLTVVPLMGRPIEIGLALWSLLAVIVAVRYALDIRTWRSILICVIGWPIVQVAIGVIQILLQELAR